MSHSPAKKLDKHVLGSTGYTLGGVLVLNGILQLVVYPWLNRKMGSEPLGALLYIMGLVAIVCVSIGQSLSTGRLVVRREADVTNGDYDCAILIFSAIGIAASLFIARKSLTGPLDIVLTIALFLFTILRYYGDVEYRLSLKYRGYFIYYSAVGVGYLAGILLYRATGLWQLIFVTGEGIGILYLALTGQVFRGFLKRSEFFPLVMRRESFLVCSYLLTNFSLNIDRIVLNRTLGDLAVTQYYVVSLIGKTLVLLVAPVNTIIISFMTKRGVRLNRKQFLLYSAAGFAVALVFFIASQIATPIFVRLFYPDLYASVRPLVTVVNLSQILGLLSMYLFMIVLTFTSEKWQFALQLAHLGILMLCIFLMLPAGLAGFSRAVLVANAIRIGAVMTLGIARAPRKTEPVNIKQSGER